MVLRPYRHAIGHSRHVYSSQ